MIRLKHFGLATLVLGPGLLVGLPACGPAPTPITNLQFLGSSSQLLDAKVTGAAQTFAWGADDLTTSLTTTPINFGASVRARLLSDVPGAEADIFVRDPASIKALLIQEQPLDDASWSAFTDPSELPRAVTLPPSSSANPPPGLQLNPILFFPSGGPGPLATNIQGQIRVQAARVYDHGHCSTGLGLELPAPVRAGPTLAPLFPQINNTFWTSFAQQVNMTGEPTGFCYQGDTSADLFSSHIISYLDHTQGDQFSASGGFLFNGHYGINTGFLGVEDDVLFQAHYQFGLTPPTPANPGGILEVTIENPGIVHVYGLAPTTVADTVKTALQDTLPQQLNKVAARAQSQDILSAAASVSGVFGTLASAARVCHPTDSIATQCAGDVGASAILDLAIMQGVSKLSDLGFDYSFEDQDALQAAAHAVDSTGKLVNWSCVQDFPDSCGTVAQENESPHHCEFAVRAKRLNVFPDELELVWFDGKEVNNPTFALWVALQGLGADPDLLCSAFGSPPSFPAADPNGHPITRSFAIDSLAPANSFSVPCPLCVRAAAPCSESLGVFAICNNGILCDENANLCPGPTAPPEFGLTVESCAYCGASITPCDGTCPGF